MLTHPIDVLDDVSGSVQHGPQDLGRHDEAGSLGLHADVTREQADIKLLLREVSELLVADGLDGRGVHGAGAMLKENTSKGALQ